MQFAMKTIGLFSDTLNAMLGQQELAFFLCAFAFLAAVGVFRVMVWTAKGGKR